MPDEELSHEKIKFLLDIYEADRKQVMILVTACFAIPAFTLAHTTPADLSLATRAVLFASLALFISAGLSLFHYVQRQNWKRLETAESILQMDPNAVRNILMGPKQGLWARAGSLYRFGELLLILASLVWAIFFFLFLFSRANYPK